MTFIFVVNVTLGHMYYIIPPPSQIICFFGKKCVPNYMLFYNTNKTFFFEQAKMKL